jgi:hypothetical protein
MKRLWSILLIFSVLLSACSTAKFYMNQQDYDTAIGVAVQKLIKNKKNWREALVLEESYKAAMTKDNLRIAELRREGNPDCWVELYEIYSRINARQNKVKIIAPVYITKQYRNADLPMMDVDQELRDTKHRAAEYLYALGKNVMSHGDKASYRKAYDDFNQVKSYYPSFNDVDSLINQCYQKGQSYVKLDYINNSNLMMPKDFQNTMLKLDIAAMNSTWVKYYTPFDQNSNLKPDYTVVINLMAVNISPEQMNSHDYTEQKTIEDGWQYLYDNRGNVRKDTLGNDIKVTVYKNVIATIRETQQLKDGNLSGSIDFYRPNNSQPVKSIPYSENLHFENMYAIYKGDPRALTDATRRKLDLKPMPFPSNIQMVMDASNMIKTRLMDALKSNQYMLLQ